MKFLIQDVSIALPFKIIYPEQIQLMYVLKNLLDKKSHGIMGIPPGIGFSILTFFFFISYKFFHKLKKKLFYCARNEISTYSFTRQLKLFFENKAENSYIKKKINEPQIISYFGKKNLCIDPRVKNTDKIDEIEDFCNNLLFGNKFEDKIREKFLWNKKRFSLKNPALVNKCIFYSNFLKKRKILEEKKIWTAQNLIDTGIKNKICSFFFYKNILNNSEIIMFSLKNLLFSDFLKDKEKNLTYQGFLIFEDFFDIESIHIFFSSTIINPIILNDCQRTLLYLKKKFFFVQNKIRKENNLREFFFVQKKNLKNRNKIGKFTTNINSKVKKNKFKVTDYSNFSNKNFRKNSARRIFHFFLMLQKIIDFFSIELERKTAWKWNTKEFLFTMFNYLSTLEISLETTKIFYYFIDHFYGFFGFLNDRNNSGLIRLIEFLRILGENSESFNTNLKIFFYQKNQDFSIVKEPEIKLACFETSFYIKCIYENFKSVIFCVPSVPEMNFLLFILDVKPMIFGNFLYFFDKKTISSSNLNLNGNFILSKTKEKNDKIDNNGKIINLLNKLLDEAFGGTVILFPSLNYLISIFSELNNPMFANKLIKKKKIFFENLFLTETISMIENYKICCDLGLQAIFFGLSRGFTEIWNLKAHYCKNLIIIDPLSTEKKSSLEVLTKNDFFLSEKFIKRYEKFFFFKNLGISLANFFTSKNDFGIFVIINKKKFPYRTNSHEKFFNFSFAPRGNKKENEILEQKGEFFNVIWYNLGIKKR